MFLVKLTRSLTQLNNTSTYDDRRKMCDDYDYMLDTGNSIQYSMEQKERMENVKNRLITNELSYRIQCIYDTETLEEQLCMIQQLLRYLWDKQNYLRKYRRYRNAIYKKCTEWVDDPLATTILSTVIMTIEILKEI